jgi:hypothetical protein
LSIARLSNKLKWQFENLINYYIKEKDKKKKVTHQIKKKLRGICGFGPNPQDYNVRPTMVAIQL